ncbi:hypothetical protein J6590_055472 [Homalodisca vitripennis]|nr:hypothetical protein J6590_055472 [Homalodisca vitripennis]
MLEADTFDTLQGRPQYHLGAASSDIARPSLDLTVEIRIRPSQLQPPSIDLASATYCAATLCHTYICVIYLQPATPAKYRACIRRLLCSNFMTYLHLSDILAASYTRQEETLYLPPAVQQLYDILTSA